MQNQWPVYSSVGFTELYGPLDGVRLSKSHSMLRTSREGGARNEIAIGGPLRNLKHAHYVLRSKQSVSVAKECVF